MKTVISGLSGPVKDAKIVGAADVYQSSCWHCSAVWFKAPVAKPTGLECAYCGQLNYYGEGFGEANLC